MADQALREFREFVDQTVAQLDRVPSLLADDGDGDEPFVITLDLTLDLDEEVMAEYERRMKRARRKYRWGILMGKRSPAWGCPWGWDGDEIDPL